MAIFKCTQCGHETVRDLRSYRHYRGKSKYKSYCSAVNKFIFMMLKK